MVGLGGNNLALCVIVILAIATTINGEYQANESISKWFFKLGLAASYIATVLIRKSDSFSVIRVMFCITFKFNWNSFTIKTLDVDLE